MNQNWHYIYIFPKKFLLRAYSTLKHSLSTMKINYRITLRSRSTFQNLETTMWLAKLGKGMLFSVEQAFAGRDERQAPLKMLAWEATEITELQGNFNLFHFQYDWMWQVKMTSETKGWSINSPNAISLDIARWPAVISSPAKLQGKCWKDDVVMLTARLSITLKCLTRCKQKVVSLQFQHGQVNTNRTTLLKSRSVTKYIP